MFSSGVHLTMATLPSSQTRVRLMMYSSSVVEQTCLNLFDSSVSSKLQKRPAKKEVLHNQLLCIASTKNLMQCRAIIRYNATVSKNDCYKFIKILDVQLHVKLNYSLNIPPVGSPLASNPAKILSSYIGNSKKF